MQYSWYPYAENNPVTINAINVANAEIENDTDEEKEPRLMKLKFCMKAFAIF